MKPKTTIVLVTNSINRSPLRRRFLLIALTSACFALSPKVRAVSPPPDGGYPNGNTAEGDNALFSLTTGGINNTANGFEALFSTTTGQNNTATGFVALLSNTTGNNNTANGSSTLQNNTTGSQNTATGTAALYLNTTGFDNTATGDGALMSNTTGNYNTANGSIALFYNTTGNYNTANGVYALENNTTGSQNTANGFQALFNSTSGGANAANGFNALFSNTTGNSNTANGTKALLGNTTGSQNTANGFNALLLNKTGNGNTAEGAGALENNKGSYNIALGFNAGGNLTTGSDNIDIFSQGVAGETNTIRIGAATSQTATYIAGISGVTVPGGVGVIVDSNGHLGTVVSSQRFKDEIKPMDAASEAILALKPVTFHYKHELDPQGIPQFGLLAEQVEKVNPDLVARDAEGKVYTVRYEAVNAMLLNEFLKEHRKVEELEATIAQEQREIKALTASFKEQASKIQKVSEQLEVSRPAPQRVVNNR